MGSRLINSYSTTSMNLLDKDEYDFYGTENYESTRSTNSIHSAHTDLNPDHPYLTRSVARRRRHFNSSDRDFISDNQESSRSSPNLITRNTRGLLNYMSRTQGINYMSRTQGINYSSHNRNRIFTDEKLGKALFCFCILSIIWMTVYILKLMSDELYKIGYRIDNLKNPSCENSERELKKCLTQRSSCDKKNEDVVTIAIRQALEEYNADKTGKTDFALETLGGSIVTVIDTEPYDVKTRTALFGFSICQETNGPRSLIQASSLPGECWAFKGTKGAVIIQLLGPVYIDGVSLEHISKSISPTGEIDSAPQDFSIWGLTEGVPGHGQQLGKFVYSAKGETLQHFPTTSSEQSYSYVQFNVLSNHGNANFTCVYRLRVHGKLDVKN